MFRQPRAGFGGDEVAALHVRGGRREFGDERTPVGAEKFRLGNVGQRVEVEQVSGRAVRLVARDETVRRATSSPRAAAVSSTMMSETVSR